MRSEEAGVAEGEDPPVGAHQPVARARRGGRHADNGRVERRATERPLEGRRTLGEDTAVGRGHPVPGGGDEGVGRARGEGRRTRRARRQAPTSRAENKSAVDTSEVRPSTARVNRILRR